MIELEQLTSDFKSFREECIQLRNLLNTYRALYESGDETEALLRKSAELFFGDLNNWLIELIFLKACRLTDPVQTGGNDNLTVAFLKRKLETFSLLSNEVKQLAEQINTYGQTIKPARNKVIAHADLESIRQSLSYGNHTNEEADEFFSNLNKFTDEVGRVIGEGALDYSVQAGAGDVVDLLRLLKERIDLANT